MTTVKLVIDSDGPIVEGHARRIVDDWTTEFLDFFASKGLSELHYQMDQYFKNPTPYYETQVTVDRAGSDRVIHDRGIIYGPWLAGTSSRNQRTRFKGYPHWRRTVQYLESEPIEREAKQLAERLSR